MASGPENEGFAVRKETPLLDQSVRAAYRLTRGKDEDPMTAQLDELIATHGIEIEDHLDRQATIPVLSGMQRQGDVVVVPCATATAETPVPRAGVAVIRGVEGAHTHALVASGDVRCDLASTVGSRDLCIATLVVAEGSVAYLAHPEHGYSGIAPGAYEIRRQREMTHPIRAMKMATAGRNTPIILGL
jgi:hypothetical protein